MFVDSVYIFPKFRKQFIQVLLLGVLDMVKDVSQRPLGFAAYSSNASLKKGTYIILYGNDGVHRTVTKLPLQTFFPFRPRSCDPGRDKFSYVQT